MAIEAAAALAMGGNMFNNMMNTGSTWATNFYNRDNNRSDYFMQSAKNTMDWNRDYMANRDMWNMNNQYNEQMWNKQNEYNLEMWKMQNEYNSPKAQMERWKEAGINPHAMYGNMSNAVGLDAGKLASASAPTVGRGSSAGMAPSNAQAAQFDLDRGIMSMYDAGLKAAQVDSVKAQTEMYKTMNTLNILKATGLEYDNKKKEAYSPYNSEIASMSVEMLGQMLRKQKQEYDFNTDANPLRLKKLDAEYHNIDAQYLRTHKMTPLEQALMGQTISNNAIVNRWQVRNLAADLENKQTQYRLNVDQHEVNSLKRQLMNIDIQMQQMNLDWLPAEKLKYLLKPY